MRGVSSLWKHALDALVVVPAKGQALHFEDEPVQPRLVQLHYVRDELIAVEAA